MSLSFSKFEGAGNDFILLDDRVPLFPASEPQRIAGLCHRQKGIGADGLILLQTSECAEFRMRIYNADGSEAAMCGNGLRCLVAFLREIGCLEKHFQIETEAGIFSCRREGERVVVAHPLPAVVEESLAMDGALYPLYLIDTGVPHAVHFVTRLEAVAVEELGRMLRFHPRFSPAGSNITFAQVVSADQLLIRTYERGVEGETLACGTAAAAAAYAACWSRRMGRVIEVVPSSRETIEVAVGETLEVAGTARYVYQGTLPQFALLA